MNRMGERWIGLTCGDPNGIGPEVVLKALARRMNEGFAEVRFRIYGPRKAMENWAERWGLSLGEFGDALEWRDLPWPVRRTRWGRADAEAGAYVRRVLEEAGNDLISRRLDALVTAPIVKHSLRLAGSPFTDHTTFLAHLFGVPAVMSMIHPRMKVAFVTAHVPLREVPNRVTPERVRATVLTAERELRERFGLRRPRMVLCGLNPHAGEEGTLGSEEHEILAPVVRHLQQMGLDLAGPSPPETVFRELLARKYDLAVALYHDQGMIPIKLIGFGETVNYTMGLPAIRTSPDHGAALDIAGADRADPGGMVAAIRLAVRLTRPPSPPFSETPED